MNAFSAAVGAEARGRRQADQPVQLPGASLRAVAVRLPARTSVAAGGGRGPHQQVGTNGTPRLGRGLHQDRAHETGHGHFCHVHHGAAGRAQETPGCKTRDQTLGATAAGIDRQAYAVALRVDEPDFRPGSCRLGGLPSKPCRLLLGIGRQEPFRGAFEHKTSKIVARVSASVDADSVVSDFRSIGYGMSMHYDHAIV